MAAQALVSTARLQRKVGTTQRVLIDHADAKAVVARSSADAPEIDGVVHLAPSPKLVAGEFANVADYARGRARPVGRRGLKRAIAT